MPGTVLGFEDAKRNKSQKTALNKACILMCYLTLRKIKEKETHGILDTDIAKEGKQMLIRKSLVKWS